MHLYISILQQANKGSYLRMTISATEVMTEIQVTSILDHKAHRLIDVEEEVVTNIRE